MFKIQGSRSKAGYSRGALGLGVVKRLWGDLFGEFDRNKRPAFQGGVLRISMCTDVYSAYETDA